MNTQNLSLRNRTIASAFEVVSSIVSAGQTYRTAVHYCDVTSRRPLDAGRGGSPYTPRISKHRKSELDVSFG